MEIIEILEQAGWTQEQMNEAGSIAVEITPEMGAVLVDAYVENGYLKFCNGTYYSQEDGVYVTYDNSDGQCFVEQFNSKALAIAWCENKFDIGDLVDSNYPYVYKDGSIVKIGDSLDRVFTKQLETKDHVWYGDLSESDENANTLMFRKLVDKRTLVSANYFANEALMTTLEQVFNGEIEAIFVSEEANTVNYKDSKSALASIVEQAEEALADQKKANAKWILITVCEREIETALFDSLEKAREQMLKELRDEFVQSNHYPNDDCKSWSHIKHLDEYDSGDYERGFAFGETWAWSNMNSSWNMDWKIVCVDKEEK